MAKRKCTNCRQELNPNEGIGSIPGMPNALLCKRCYKSITNPN